ncbi:MAG: hypothetical protein D8B50_03175 [Prevotella sp.]|nr:MAG: hypothetical protein D8B50_03175 [Prevotella sp.]
MFLLQAKLQKKDDIAFVLSVNFEQKMGLVLLRLRHETRPAKAVLHAVSSCHWAFFLRHRCF